MVEFRLLSDLIHHLASTGRKLEILRGHTDSFGYDLVLKVDDVSRYVQLKSVKRGGSVPNWIVHKSLLRRKNGTVVLVTIDYVSQGMSLKYRILDEDKRLGVLEKKPKPNIDSKTYCRITRGDLHGEESIDGLASRLFPSAENSNG